VIFDEQRGDAAQAPLFGTASQGDPESARPAQSARPATPIPARSVPASGTARVQAALSELDGVQQRPLAEHAESYARVHAQLQAVLTEIDGA
jgi:hypothetical protein